MRFHIITAAYESPAWIRGCLESVANQTHRDFKVCVVDDCSPSEEQRLIIKEICEREGENWQYIFNEEKKTTLQNQVMAIRSLNPDPEDVIVFVDGDDRLAHDRVLERLVEHYSDGTLLTYGNYKSEPFSPTCAPPRQYPPDVVRRRSYREFARTGGIWFNHLRTFRAVLFQQLDDSDFQDDSGRWLQAGPDSALMMPCMELAGNRMKVLSEILYIYNSDNPISDWRRWPRQVDADHDIILRKPKKDVLRVDA